MNRRIPQDHESQSWRLVSSVLVFLAALAIAALLSIDDYQPRNPNTDIQP